MLMQGVIVLCVLQATSALLIGTAAQLSSARAPAAHADLSAFEKSFMDDLYMEEYLDKNKAMRDLREAMPSLLQKADAPALRQGVDEAREAGASLVELKPFVEALKEADPTLLTETDAAILKGVEQVVAASAPQPARKPPDSFLTDDQFQVLLTASKSPVPSYDAAYDPTAPDDLIGIWGRPLNFFSLLRHPTVDPSPVVWDVVRKQWPALQGVPDEELQKNLVECRKEYVDGRFLSGE